jgi:hypothetical protein
MDFLKAAVEGTPFFCHAPQDGKMCSGWVNARAAMVATPPPQQLLDLVKKWEFSKSDDTEIEERGKP